MESIKHIAFLWLIISSCTAAPLNKEKQATIAYAVNLENENIKLTGANYIQRSEAKISFLRFSETILAMPTNQLMFNAEKARTCSGITLQFKTASPTIDLVFVPEQGLNRGADYAAYRNGSLVETFNYTSKESADSMFITLSGNGEAAEWEITLPSFANVALVRMQLQDELLPFVKSKAVYLAIGNSITHGVGQKSGTYLTYPYLLAKALNVELYNLATGGAKISQALAETLGEYPEAELITLLIGYNDLHFNNKSVEDYKADYEAFLNTLRKHQKKAKVYCISLTHTRSTGNEETGIVPDDYRAAAKEVVSILQKKDDKLFFIAGESITSEANLRQDNPNDKTHLGIDGAALFAKELEAIIK